MRSSPCTTRECWGHWMRALGRSWRAGGLDSWRTLRRSHCPCAAPSALVRPSPAPTGPAASPPRGPPTRGGHSPKMKALRGPPRAALAPTMPP
ncbi:hypothetical protein XENTR_v10017505 [Xenopus tropicalis]|nr:hypothetical protein XENTR_v10017505 [Xenopus tropicalis]